MASKVQVPLAVIIGLGLVVRRWRVWWATALPVVGAAYGSATLYRSEEKDRVS